VNSEVFVRKIALAVLLVFSLLPGAISGQQADSLSPLVIKYVRVRTPPAIEDQNVIIGQGKITAVQAGADVTPAENTAVLNFRGYTVLPGIVGMHDHLFYIAGPDFEAGITPPASLSAANDLLGSKPLPRHLYVRAGP
jgi:imidazolonepropionase-like amidohydrolase